MSYVVTRKFTYYSAKNSRELNLTPGDVFNCSFNEATRFYTIEVQGDIKYRLTGVAWKTLLEHSQPVKTVKEGGLDLKYLTRWWDSLSSAEQRRELSLIQMVPEWFTTGAFGKKMRLSSKPSLAGMYDSQAVYEGAPRVWLRLRRLMKKLPPVRTVYRVQAISRTALVRTSTTVTPLKDMTSFSLSPDIKDTLLAILPKMRGGPKVLLTVRVTDESQVLFDYRWVRSVLNSTVDHPWLNQIRKSWRVVYRSFLLEEEIVLYTPKPFRAKLIPL